MTSTIPTRCDRGKSILIWTIKSEKGSLRRKQSWIALMEHDRVCEECWQFRLYVYDFIDKVRRAQHNRIESEF